jgi:hypothetical protein
MSIKRGEPRFIDLTCPLIHNISDPILLLK